MKFHLKENNPVVGDQHFWITLEGNNGQPIMVSETYTRKWWAKTMITRMRKDIPDAELIDETK